MRILLTLTSLLALATNTSAFQSNPTGILVQPLGSETRQRRIALTRSYSSSDASSSDGLTRRQMGQLALGAAGVGITIAGTAQVNPTDYGLWGIVPVGTYKSKKTIRETIVPGQMWTFDQKFGILDVQVPLRMTVIRLKNGGLFVYNPIAATN